jgi:hypothetical protein
MILPGRPMCPMAEAGCAGPCGRCWQDPEGFEECLDQAADFESMLSQDDDREP